MTPIQARDHVARLLAASTIAAAKAADLVPSLQSSAIEISRRNYAAARTMGFAEAYDRILLNLLSPIDTENA